MLRDRLAAVAAPPEPGRTPLETEPEEPEEGEDVIITRAPAEPGEIALQASVEGDDGAAQTV